MLCHCADQIRLALGTIRAEEYGALTPEKVITLSKAGKTVPAAKGLGQVERWRYPTDEPGQRHQNSKGAYSGIHKTRRRFRLSRPPLFWKLQSKPMGRAYQIPSGSPPQAVWGLIRKKR